MKKKSISLLIIVLLTFMTTCIVAKNTYAVTDEKSFLLEFLKALESKSQARMEELVKRAGPHVVYEAVISQTMKGIAAVAEGKDGTTHFNAAEAITAIYVKEFRKEALLDLVKKYRDYNQEMCKEKMLGDRIKEEGNLLADKGRSKEALVKWEEALKIYDKLGDLIGKGKVINNIGTFYADIEQYTEALNYYEQSLEISRSIGDLAGEARSYGNIGSAYILAGKYTEALNYCKRDLEISKKIGDLAGEAGSLGNIGIIFEKLGQYTEALNSYHQALMIDPKSEKTYYVRGRTYYAMGEYDLAISDFNQAIKIDERFVDAYYIRGLAHHAKGQFDPAISDYKKVVELYPKSLYAYYNLGEVYDKKGEFDEAILNYKKAIEINPEFEEAYYNRGHVYYQKGQYDQAVLDFTKVIEKKPGYANAFHWRGNCYYMKGQYDLAISDYTKTIEIEPGNSNAYYNRGNAYRDIERYNRAILDYTKAIKINSKYFGAYKNRGFIYSNKRQYDQAISDYNKAIEIDPNNDEVYIYRGFAYEGKDQYDQAISDYTKAIKINPKSVDAYYKRAINYHYNKGNYILAISDYTRAIEIDPGYAMVYYNRAKCYEDMDQFNEAIESYESFLKKASSDRESLFIKHAEEKIEELKNILVSSVGPVRNDKRINDEENIFDEEEIYLGGIFPFREMDEEAFLRKFIESYRANDQSAMVELVKKEKGLAFHVAILLIEKAITSIAEGIDQQENINISLEIGKIYSDEFEEGHLLALINPYKEYSKEICIEWKLGNDLKKEGKRLFNLGKKKEALKKWEEALKIFDKINDLNGKMKIIDTIRYAFGKLRQYAKELEYSKQSLEIKHKIRDVSGECTELRTIGGLYRVLGQKDKTLEYYKQSLDLSRKAGNASEEDLSLSSIASFYKGKGQFTEALKFYEYLLDLRRKTGKVSLEILTLHEIGQNYNWLCQYEKALEYYGKSVELSRKIGDMSLEIHGLFLLAGIHRRLSQYAETLKCYENSLGLIHKRAAFKRDGLPDILDKWSYGEADAFLGISYVYGDLGLYDKAIIYGEQTLGGFRNKKELIGEAISLLNIGHLYYILGKDEKALRYCEDSLGIFRKNVGTGGEGIIGAGTSLRIIGAIHEKLGHYDKALDYYNNSLETVRRMKDERSEAISFLTLGYFYYDQKQYSKAIEYIEDSLEILIKYKDLEYIWRAHRLLGLILWKSGDLGEAITLYEKAIKTIENIYGHTKGLKEEERSSMIGGKSFVYKEFIELLLELHRKHSNKGYDKEAFLISEKFKSRTFQELMAKASAKIAFTGDETFRKTIGKEQQLIGQVTNLRGLIIQELSKPENQRNEEVIRSFQDQLSKVEKMSVDIEKEIEFKYPRYADLKRPKPLTVEELQEILKPDETVVSYAVGKDKIAAFVIGKKSFKLIEIGTSREELSKLIRRIRRGLEDVREIKDLEKFKPKVAYEIYRKIFQPLSSELKGITKLYISADDILYTLPFEALVDKEINEKAFDEARERGGVYLSEYNTLHYLIDTYTITYLPSASVLRSLRKYEKPGYGKWQRPLIAFADPIFSEEDRDKVKEKVEVKGEEVKQKGISQETQLTVQILTRSTGSEKLERLKESAQEAEAISKELKGKREDIYLREKTTEENIYKTDLKDSRYLLFSTHGLLGGDFSGVAEPALALTLIDNPPGRDGFLTMSEVLGLDLNSELIILSACNTSGKGDKSGSGEGFVGLTRSFMYAGGKSLMVTHWSVESESARDLMVNTMRLMKGKTKPESLREAKLSMKNSTRQKGNEKLSLSHPFFWAPFVLVGEGK